MANRFTLPVSQELDGNGDPYAGAKLHFYETGTSTPLDTYSDSSLSTANANPVVADANGRFSDIFLKTQDYKVVLKTSADVTIWTADPVAGTATATETKGSDIASAATTDIGASSGQYVEVTGTTTITALGTTDAGVRRVVRFMGVLTLTYNATSLILPGNANITSTADDCATFISLGSGNWMCVDYQRGSVVADVSLSTAQEFTKQQNFNETTLTYDATQDWDLASNQVAVLTLTGNTTFDAPTNMVAGAFNAIRIIQDGTGSRTAAWNAVFKFPGGTAPTLTTTASAKDLFVFWSDGTNMYLVGKQLDVK